MCHNLVFQVIITSYFDVFDTMSSQVTALVVGGLFKLFSQFLRMYFYVEFF